MLILHAGFTGDHFLVWGERSEGPAPEQTLTEVLPVRGRSVEATAWLPSGPDAALTSSRLFGELSALKHPRIAPWTVPALALSPSAILELSAYCYGKHLLQPGVVVGCALAYWTAAARLAAALVLREQFLPDVVEGEDGWYARWRAVLTGPEAERATQLARLMPSSARALSLDDEVEPDLPAALVLQTFLDLMVDHMVRSASGGWKAGDSTHGLWLAALHSSDARIAACSQAAAQLALQVREWKRALTEAAQSRYRLVLRLEEPPSNDEPWFVRYLVQDRRDPSLLVPAAAAWNAGKRSPLGQDARTDLLLALGQAAGISAAIEDSLRTAVPQGYSLDATGAFEFLTRDAAALEQTGFGVLLPAWWSRKGTKARLTARAKVRSPKMAGTSGLSLAAVIDFDWEIALGEEKLTRQELLALAKLKVPLVKVRGQWVQLTSGEIEAALAYLRKKGQATAGEIVQMALGAAPDGGGLEFEGVSASGWIADLLAQLEGRRGFAELEQPRDFHGTLRAYQLRGYSWLEFLKQWGLGACLADDMGLGKTVQALALIVRERQDGETRPFLLICPTSVVGNWQKEAERFTPELAVLVHHGVSRTRGETFRHEAAKHAIVLSSYSLLQRDIGVLKQVRWAAVILDEAQNIKNPETRQAGAARALEAGHRIALTGTPVENNVGDLWSIMQFLNPGFLGSQAAFKRKFFLPIQVQRDPIATERLKRLTGPFILRRLKTDRAIIADLPEKLEMKVYCRLTKEQATLYAAVVKDAEEQLESAEEGIARKGLILATLSKLKQVCNHPAQFLGDNSLIPDRSGKLARLTEMLEEALETGDRALVFSQFAEMGAIIQTHLHETFGREVLFLHGGVLKKQRDRMIDRFQNEADGPRIFMLSLKAGGTGLNLTRANHVFHFDRWWNPAVENQATDRAFRIGQKKNVQVHKFVCMGTLEERIDEMIERKREIAGAVVGTGEGWLTELSNSELKQLFALRKEAVAE
jgi:SNF2 family DNA or RNA helicase